MAITIKQILVFIIILSPGFANAHFKIKLLDRERNPVSQAVISIATKLPSGPVESIAIMDQIDKQFTPYVLIIHKEQLVSFPNSDNIRHHVYSFSEPKTFEIKLYRGTPGSPDLFDKPGIVILGCNIHDHMVGYIYVAENEITAITDENGIAILESKVPEAVKIWHAQLSDSSDKSISVPLVDRNDEDIWQVIVDLHPPVVKEPRKFKARFKQN